ncbi:methyltransferase, FxLD system [Actinomycetes bacterium KLBMP 9759]
MSDRPNNEMVDRLVSAGTIVTGTVEAAMRAVPRHLFLPGVEPDQAYADQPVHIKTDAGGTSISAASQPSIVAAMLEQLGCEPGHRVLEIGAGTGYNAALLARLAGGVTTVDIDDDLVAAARSNLSAAGCAARVVLGDGSRGHPPAAPYDRIVATVGTHHVPRAWLDQLVPGGRLVVPQRIRGSHSRSIAYEHRDGTWSSVSSVLAGFMPLRGVDHDDRHVVDLAGAALYTHSDQDIDPSAIHGVLTTPRHRTWTGVVIRSTESLEWLELWLTTELPNGLSRMPVTGDRTAVERLYRWGSSATVEGGALAYLTRRLAPPDTDGTVRYEIGTIGHGQGGAALAGRVDEAVRAWNDDHRGQEATFALHPTGAGTSYEAVTHWPRARSCRP